MAQQEFRPSPYDEEGRYTPWSGDFEPTGQPRSIRSSRGGYRAPGFFGYGAGDLVTPSTPRPAAPPNMPAPAALRGLFADRSGGGDGSNIAGIGPTTTDFGDFSRAAVAALGFPGSLPSIVAGMLNNTPPVSIVDLVNSLTGGQTSTPPSADEIGEVTGTPELGMVDQDTTPDLTGIASPETGGMADPSLGVDTSTNTPSENNAPSTGGPGAPTGGGGGGGGGGGSGGGGGGGGGSSSGEGSGSPGAGSGADPGGAGTGPARHGRYIRPDGDKKLEPRRLTAHEGEFVVRPEAVRATGLQALRRINARGNPPPPAGKGRQPVPARSKPVAKTGNPLFGIRARRVNSR